MVPDCHIHTYLCHHAIGHPRDYRETARRNGIPEICLADHMPAPDGYDPDNRMSPDDYPTYRAMFNELMATSHSVPVRFGIEADYYPGCESHLREWLPRQNFDLIIGSVHYLGAWGFDNPLYAGQWDQVNLVDTWRHYFKLIAGMADTRLYDIVGHLDVTKKFGHQPAPDQTVALAEPALDRIAAAGMAIEINTSGLRKPVGEMYPALPILHRAYQREIPIVFGSDSHAPEEVGFAFNQAVACARQAGYRHYVRYQNRIATRHPLPG
ncbi:MAG: hypothetical protein A2498_00780 [Lentisphaerae bacterium RIFOXYC12_FULL_60_16]|nr:MAG: hypothetical protein A2498_00780 [Lentisphaerae bacterium RIFOXYC12_FULL_60_16]OGV74878.1 MAG: hypothetical protein A2269_06605 [Lentisphaerae bacterium RIFOXYA12_FULL_60_10]OGV76285.1 MAG: hypothetical protein A2340_08905 [Lentisphaerae bacterium RIFOXYB12_FULL_60_10]